jgi:endonuclease/exonuclease/phosphatase family metal-dependent hydrolase
MVRTALLAVAVVACGSHPPAERGIVLTSASHATDELPATFQIVTFNVHRRPGDSIARGIALDPMLREADLIALQEVRGRGDCGAACVAARELGMNAAYEPDFHLDDGTLGQALLTRAPIESTRLVTLPTYVSRNVALVVTVRIGGQRVTVYVVHLTDELSIDERLRQMTPVLEDARTSGTPVIIAGDFNTDAVFIGHKIPIVDGASIRRFEALVRSYGFDTPVADSGPTFRVLPMKLDGIYTRGFVTHRFGTAHGHDISDHLALWAIMSLVAA